MFKNMTGKQLALALGFIVIVAAILRISEAATQPGRWECRDGQWIKQGKTNAAMPTAVCAPLQAEEDKQAAETLLPAEEDVLLVTSPSPAQIQAREITIKGEAREDWFSDKSFYASLLDESGQMITTASVRDDGSVREGIRAFAGRIALPEEEALPMAAILRLDPAENKEYVSVFVPIEIR